VKLRKFYTSFDHARASGHAQIASGAFQPGKTAHNRADCGAIDVRDLGKIKNHKDFFGPDELIGFLLQTAAIRAGMDAALHLKDGDALLRSGFGEV
jgi:hypothetical protein